MSNKFSSKYSEIIIDQNPNSPNKTMQKKMSIEEYYDLMHHTHRISDLVNNTGIDSEESSSVLLAIAELKSVVEAQQNTINELKETINYLKNQIDNNALEVSDWDLETEGNQDINGNILNG